MRLLDKDALTERFVIELSSLRARIGMTQDEVGDIIGVSRQTYSAIETKKQNISWAVHMALLLVFYENPTTRRASERAELFPDELKTVLKVNHRTWRI